MSSVVKLVAGFLSREFRGIRLIWRRSVNPGDTILTSTRSGAARSEVNYGCRGNFLSDNLCRQINPAMTIIEDNTVAAGNN